jgi:hypothetical protein
MKRAVGAIVIPNRIDSKSEITEKAVTLKSATAFLYKN